MMYYNVAKIGTGTSDDPYRPDVTVGVAWVGVDLNDGTFLVGVQATISGLTPLTDSQLTTICANKGILYSDVTAKWFVA